MKIKGVSPLIATIILIALTISIGAIIVAWGRSYVQKQMTCAGMSASLDYESHLYNNTGNYHLLYFLFINTGDSPINLEDAYIKITSADLSTSDTCFYSATGSCSFGVTGNISVLPQNEAKIIVGVSNNSPVFNELAGAKVEIYDKACGNLLADVTLPYSIS